MDRKTLLKITEEYIKRVKGGMFGNSTEVYKNPSRSEMKTIARNTADGDIRWMIDPKKKVVYMFSSRVLHMEISRAMFNKDDVYRNFICGEGKLVGGKIDITGFSTDCFDNFGAMDLEWAEIWLEDIDTKWRIETN